MKNTAIHERVGRIREWLGNNGFQAIVIPSSDPHNSEYTPTHWKVREWATGFDGSAGTAVITLDDAALWTDSRYYLSAEAQLAGTPYRLMKDGLPETCSPGEWLESVCNDEQWRAVCVDEMMTSELFRSMATDMFEFVTLETVGDCFNELWTNRPPLADAPVRLHASEFCTTTIEERLRMMRQSVEKVVLWEGVFYNNLDDIAWILGLRGSDVPFNPVFVSYLLIRQADAVLYIDEKKVPEDVCAVLEASGVIIRPYNSWNEDLQKICPPCSQLVMTEGMNCKVLRFCEEQGIEFEVLPSAATDLRSRKSEREAEGFRRAMERDGVALVKFRRWLDENVASGSLTEIAVDEKLSALRAEQPGFVDLSFATIAAYGPHGAIVHYEATPESAAPLRPEGLLLLDSGAHYEEGTTDITRTIALGPLTAEERRVYTLVLKGHIALSRCRFPLGAAGVQLDLAARYAMWQEGYDYGHGTGHGVGVCLSVHEGPHQIRKNINAASSRPLLPGMTVTNEPGIYLAGKFGVRIENTLLIRDEGEQTCGRFCSFEPLTLCPIDTAPIEPSMLTTTEREWLNAYHAEVRRRLLPLLADEADRQWLTTATQAL